MPACLLSLSKFLSLVLIPGEIVDSVRVSCGDERSEENVGLLSGTVAPITGPLFVESTTDTGLGSYVGGT